MVKYSKDVVNDSKVAKAGNMHIRVHYKHCHEISQAIEVVLLLVPRPI